MSQNEWFLSLLERLHSTINTLTMQYFTYNWHDYIYNTHSQFNNCWFLTVYQVTTNAQHCPPPQLLCTATHLNMDCWTLSKVMGQLRMVWQAQKCVGEVSLHFQLELNTPGNYEVW